MSLFFIYGETVSAGARKELTDAVPARTDAMARTLPDRSHRSNRHAHHQEKNSERVEAASSCAGQAAPLSCGERNGLFPWHGSRLCCSRFSLLPPEDLAHC